MLYIYLYIYDALNNPWVSNVEYDLQIVPVTATLNFRDILTCLATRYRLKGSWFEFRWGEIFHTFSDWFRGPRSFLCKGYQIYLPGVKRSGCEADSPPPLALRLSMYIDAFQMACYGMTFTFIFSTGTLI
jgi:hypothetical protein